SQEPMSLEMPIGQEDSSLLGDFIEDDKILGPVKADLALVEIAAPVTDVTTFGLYDRSDEHGQEVILLGRGDFGDGNAGVKGVDHKLRRVTNRIDSADKKWLSFRFDPPPDCTPLEGVCGEGDSGGPALIRRDSQWLVAGVSSWQEHFANPLG